MSLCIDSDLIDAVAYCRIGGRRPKNESAFHAAKELGLLAQDDVWRATANGEGLLVAAGLLDGKPAPERIPVAMRWAICDRYPRPHLVGVWTELAWEHVDTDAVDEEFRAITDGHDWRFWTTLEYVDLPKVRTDAAWRTCTCCARQFVVRKPGNDQWRGRLDSYCDDCAAGRCDAYPGECPAAWLAATQQKREEEQGIDAGGSATLATTCGEGDPLREDAAALRRRGEVR